MVEGDHRQPLRVLSVDEIVILHELGCKNSTFLTAEDIENTTRGYSFETIEDVERLISFLTSVTRELPPEDITRSEDLFMMMYYYGMKTFITGRIERDIRAGEGAGWLEYLTQNLPLLNNAEVKNPTVVLNVLWGVLKSHYVQPEVLNQLWAISNIKVGGERGLHFHPSKQEKLYHWNIARNTILGMLASNPQTPTHILVGIATFEIPQSLTVYDVESITGVNETFTDYSLMSNPKSTVYVLEKVKWKLTRQKRKLTTLLTIGRIHALISYRKRYDNHHLYRQLVNANDNLQRRVVILRRMTKHCREEITERKKNSTVKK